MRWVLVGVVAVALVHAVALRWMAEAGVAAALLSAATDLPPGPLLAAAGFVAVRVFVFVALPGLLVAAAVLSWPGARRPPA